MKQGIFKAAAVLAVLLTSSVAYAGANAPARQGTPGAVVNFEGSDCTVDCIEGASASLTFNDGYSLGDEFSIDDLFDFAFESDSGVFNGFVAQSFAFAEGALFGTDNELSDVRIVGTALVEDSVLEQITEVSEDLFTGLISFDFRTSDVLDDEWSMTASVIRVIDDQDTVTFQVVAADDIGLTGIWTPTREVSEPGMLVLFGIGLIGMGLARRRKTAAL